MGDRTGGRPNSIALATSKLVVRKITLYAHIFAGRYFSLLWLPFPPFRAASFPVSVTAGRQAGCLPLVFNFPLYAAHRAMIAALPKAVTPLFYRPFSLRNPGRPAFPVIVTHLYQQKEKTKETSPHPKSKTNSGQGVPGHPHPCCASPTPPSPPLSWTRAEPPPPPLRPQLLPGRWPVGLLAALPRQAASTCGAETSIPLPHCLPLSSSGRPWPAQGGGPCSWRTWPRCVCTSGPSQHRTPPPGIDVLSFRALCVCLWSVCVFVFGVCVCGRCVWCVYVCFWLFASGR